MISQNAQHIETDERKLAVITSAEREKLCFRSGPSVCLCVCDSDEIFGGVGRGPRTIWLDFGDDLDHDSDPGPQNMKILARLDCFNILTCTTCGTFRIDTVKILIRDAINASRIYFFSERVITYQSI